MERIESKRYEHSSQTLGCRGTVPGTYKDLTSVNVRTRDDEERLPEPIYVPTEGEARERLKNSPIKQLSRQIRTSKSCHGKNKARLKVALKLKPRYRYAFSYSLFSVQIALVRYQLRYKLMKAVALFG